MIGRHYPKKYIPKILFVRKDDIYAEIDAQLQILAEARPDKNGAPNPALYNAMQRFEAQFDRWTDKYLDKTKSRVQAFLQGVQRKATMNQHRLWDEAEIHLSFPEYWDERMFPGLGNAVQDYIVNSCLYELLSLVLTANDAVTVSKMNAAEDAYSTIKHCIVTCKPGTQQKKLSPF